MTSKEVECTKFRDRKEKAACMALVLRTRAGKGIEQSTNRHKRNKTTH
jgi:hypothetical protein